MGQRRYFQALGLAVTALALASCGQNYKIDLTDTESLEDTFKVSKFSGKVDVLFVIDNSGSMAEEVANVKASIDKFIGGFIDSGIDYHIGVTATDGLPMGAHWSGEGTSPYPNHDNYGPGSLISARGRPRFLDSSMARGQVATDLSAAVDLGLGGSGREAGLFTSTLFLSDPRVADYNKDFVRDDALFGLIIVSDEDESMNPEGGSEVYIRRDAEKTRARVEKFATTFKELKPGRPDLLSYNAVVGPSAAECSSLEKEEGDLGTGDVYISTAELLGGRVLNICSDFSTELGDLSTKLATQPGRRFALTGKVVFPETMKVTIDGTPIAISSTEGYTFDAKSNTITLHGLDLESKGNYSVTVEYAARKAPAGGRLGGF